jgi:cation:H+ antiporter
MSYWFIFFGCVLFAAGSYGLVRGLASIARTLGLPQLTIGLLVVAAASASPELFVVLGGIRRSPDLAVGGIVGGVILTLTFMIGFGALIRPLASPPKVVFRDCGALLLVCAVYLVFALNGTIGPVEGGFLLALFVGYFALAVYTDWRRVSAHSVARERAEMLENSNLGLFGGLFVAAFGVVAVMLGAHFVLTGGTLLAREQGVPEYAVGLTVVALAVSLPEFLVILHGALRGPGTVALGQAVVSNIFNLTLVLGVAALFSPIRIGAEFVAADNIVTLGICAAVPPLVAMRWRLSRPRGFFLILVYGIYLSLLAARVGFWSLPPVKFW